MGGTTPDWRRLALIARLVETSPGGALGRTALVKLVYLLQEVRGVPLGYRFRLYTYGPYDTNVLDDLDYAQSLGVVQVKTVSFSSGYAFDIRPGDAAEGVKERAKGFLAEHEAAVRWVIQEFGTRSASELELLATIVYTDRDLSARKARVSLEDLCRKVRDVKPRFTQEQAVANARSLLAQGVLTSIAPEPFRDPPK
jgi:uncharacterized protein YwgA